MNELLPLLPLAGVLIATGCVAGILAGLLGVGCGIIVVPVLFTMLGLIDIDPSVRMHVAVGTSLASIVLTSLVSARSHHKRGAVDTDLFKEPVRLFRDEFAELDNKLGEVVTVFGDAPSLKTMLRRGRDQLLRRLAPWKDITEDWARMGADATDPFAVVPYLRDLYRFMAPRYVPADEWELMLSQNNLGEAHGPQGKVVTWFERDPKVA